jgi:hypothetical protein
MRRPATIKPPFATVNFGSRGVGGGHHRQRTALTGQKRELLALESGGPVRCFEILINGLPGCIEYGATSKRSLVYGVLMQRVVPRA